MSVSYILVLFLHVFYSTEQKYRPQNHKLMKNLYLTLLISALGITALHAQDLYIKFQSEHTVDYALATVHHINFSVTDMKVHLWGGNIQSYGLDSICYYKFQPTTVGLPTVKNKEKILLYPNPSNGLVHLSHYLKETTKTKILIYNISGQLIWSRSKDKSIGELTETLNLKAIGLKSGIYFIELKTKSKRFINKLILNP